MASPVGHQSRKLSEFLSPKYGILKSIANLFAKYTWSRVSQIVENTGWLFIDRVIRMGVNLVVGLWLARYLGPEQFGTLNYVFSFVAIFSAIATFGLDNIVVRDLVRHSNDADEILGSSFVLKLAGSVATFLLATVCAILLRHETPLVSVIIVIYATSILFQSFDVIELWFQSQVAAKYTIVPKHIAFQILAIVKVLLIWSQASLLTFALAGVLELALGAVGLALSYRLAGRSYRHWSFSIARAKALLIESWPLIMSAITVILYMKIDQVMIGQMVGDRAVGIYAAAVRLSEIWYFVPVSIAASVFPTIVKTKQHDQEQYDLLMQSLYDGMVWLFVGIALPVTFFAQQLVELLYGSAYLNSASILCVHIWSSIFIALSAIRSKWLASEGLLKFAFFAHAVGLISNLGLNLLLIPSLEGLGAAISTLISYAFAGYLSCFFLKATQPTGKMMTMAFFAPLRFAKIAFNHK